MNTLLSPAEPPRDATAMLDRWVRLSLRTQHMLAEPVPPSLLRLIDDDATAWRADA